MRYLAQRYTMPYKECKATLTDIGREAPEMFHLRGLLFFWRFTLRTVYAFCNRVAPFEGEQVQIHVNMVFII
ncbi:MAG: hypothetical protein HFI14_11640, partial [Lachnospiraceae bacterium]|nr:hypothetical protein [Lachnospiraceae bacterium]